MAPVRRLRGLEFQVWGREFEAANLEFVVKRWRSLWGGAYTGARKLSSQLVQRWGAGQLLMTKLDRSSLFAKLHWLEL